MLNIACLHANFKKKKKKIFELHARWVTFLSIVYISCMLCVYGRYGGVCAEVKIMDRKLAEPSHQLIDKICDKQEGAVWCPPLIMGQFANWQKRVWAANLVSLRAHCFHSLSAWVIQVGKPKASLSCRVLWRRKTERKTETAAKWWIRILFKGFLWCPRSDSTEGFMEFLKVGRGQCSKDFTGFDWRCTA